MNMLAKWSKESAGFCLEQNHQTLVRKENFWFLLWWWICLQNVTSPWLPSFRVPMIPDSWQTGLSFQAARFPWDSQHPRGFQWTNLFLLNVQGVLPTSICWQLPQHGSSSTALAGAAPGISPGHTVTSKPCLCLRITGEFPFPGNK